MSQTAKGEPQAFSVNIDTAWHDASNQPLVSVQLGEMGVAISPEAAIQLGLQIIATAHSSLEEANVRYFLSSQGLDKIQVIAALTSYRALVKARSKARRQTPMSGFMHDERVLAADGNAQKAFEAVTCSKCAAAPNVFCERDA